MGCLGVRWDEFIERAGFLGRMIKVLSKVYDELIGTNSWECLGYNVGWPCWTLASYNIGINPDPGCPIRPGCTSRMQHGVTRVKTNNELYRT